MIHFTVKDTQLSCLDDDPNWAVLKTAKKRSAVIPAFIAVAELTLHGI